MLDNEPTGGDQTGATPADTAAETAAPARRTRRRTTKAVADPPGAPPGAAAGAAGADTGAARTDTGASQTDTGAAQADTAGAAAPTRRRRKVAKAPAEPAPAGPEEQPTVPAADLAGDGEPPAEPVKKATRTRRKKATPAAAEPDTAAAAGAGGVAPALSVPAAAPESAPAAQAAPSGGAADAAPRAEAAPPVEAAEPAAGTSAAGRRRAPLTSVLFVAPAVDEQPAAGQPAAGQPAAGQPAAGQPAAGQSAAEPAEGRSRRRRGHRAEIAAEPETAEVVEESPVQPEEAAAGDENEDEDDATEEGRRRRRRGRRGRGRGKGGADEIGDESAEAGDDTEADDDSGEEEAEEDAGEATTRRRRRRRRRGAGDEEPVEDDGVPTVVRIREPRAARDQVQGVSGSTRLEAKRQRRRDGREQRRTRPPILSEAEFLARREAVDRTMVIRQRGDRTQIAVLEDKILVEHYVTRTSSGSMVGNVYLGKVQNVLPSMEAAFVDVGRGRNAVLYAGEVNWDASGLEGRARSIEQALRSGDPVLVQVTKDPIGHKGARLTSHVALSGRHLVYVPNGNASGISRKLSDTERKRLRDILKKLVPDGAGVIVRTAAEGATEDDLARDVKRLQAQWEDIQAKAGEGGAPTLLYEEPDLAIRVVRDLFNEDFRELVIEGSGAYDMVESYLSHVSPDLVARLSRHTGTGDVFAQYRIDEQILKGLDRKVYLPSGGHLVIDRTEAMTVIDVNTGKYTGAGGNLEETVTRNNLEAAEEIVRQLRLRDLGGIVVIDFIDMVLESNRELVLRRLTECLGRDRTKHQVTEITSLGLVQMTRKRIGQGLLEAFSETCEHCKGRGLILHTEPVPEKKPARQGESPGQGDGDGSGRKRGRRGRGGGDQSAEAAADEADETTGEVPAVDGAGPDADASAGPDEDDATVGSDAPDEDEDGLVAAGGHRRGRRGGSRRRSR